MTRERSIIELGLWLQTVPGRYVLQWEQERLDDLVADAFGFHALQLGLPEIDGLRANRMPHRWVACEALASAAAGGAAIDGMSTLPVERPAALVCAFDALPFPNQSLDLVVLTHTLELVHDPHRTLREVERVLRPEGRVVVTGFNPASLWGLRQRLGHARLGIGIGRRGGTYLPREGEFIGYWRMRDWLRLLGFDIEGGRFGCYRPPFTTQRWLDRSGWMDRVGERWWPVLGAAYALVAVKRVRGMRLVGLVRREQRKRAGAAVIARREAHTAREPLETEVK